MEVDPVEDPDELAEIAKCEAQIPLAEFDYAHALRPGGRRAYGFNVSSGPKPSKQKQLRTREVRELSDAMGQSRARLQILCAKVRFALDGSKRSCGEPVAIWRHVVGGRRSEGGHPWIPQPEWEQRQRAWGSMAERWCGWLVEDLSQRKFRDYQDNEARVTVTCPRCGRQDIRINLRRVQEKLIGAPSGTLEDWF